MYVSPGDSLEHLSDCKKTIVRNASLHGGECKGYQKGVDFEYKDRWWPSPKYTPTLDCKWLRFLWYIYKHIVYMYSYRLHVYIAYM